MENIYKQFFGIMIVLFLVFVIIVQNSNIQDLKSDITRLDNQVEVLIKDSVVYYKTEFKLSASKTTNLEAELNDALVDKESLKKQLNDINKDLKVKNVNQIQKGTVETKIDTVVEIIRDTNKNEYKATLIDECTTIDLLLTDLDSISIKISTNVPINVIQVVNTHKKWYKPWTWFKKKTTETYVTTPCQNTKAYLQTININKK